MQTLRDFFTRTHGMARICCIVLGVGVALLPFSFSGLRELSYIYSAFSLLLYLCALCDIHARRIPNEFLLAGLVLWACGVVGIVYTAFVNEELTPILTLLAVFIFDAFGLGLILIAIDHLFGMLSRTPAHSSNDAQQDPENVSQYVSPSCGCIGAGDIKLMCLLALITPPLPLVATLLIACIASIVYARALRTRTFPWAPFIVGAWYLCVLTPFYSSITDAISTFGIF